MKILLLSCLTENKSGNIYGGAEKSIINLANYLSKQYNVYLASVEGKARAFDIDPRVTFIGSDNLNRYNKIITHFRMLKNTWEIISKVDPDIIISYWIHPMFYTCLLSKFRKKTLIYSERNDPNLEYGRLSKILRYIVTKSVNGIVFQTQDAQNYFSEDIRKKSMVIHNPVYIKYGDYPFKMEMDNRIVSVGRLEKQKNHLLLINSFKKISEKYPNLVLEIYGGGSLKSELQRKILELKLEEKVFLKGSCSNVLDKILSARLFVLSSNYEGMPNALMEAMCLGVPSLSSDCPCGGPRELIQNRQNGYLFSNQDENSLLQKMDEILSLSPDMLNELRRNSRMLCETHSQDKIFGQWIAYIEKLYFINRN